MYTEWQLTFLLTRAKLSLFCCSNSSFTASSCDFSCTTASLSSDCTCDILHTTFIICYGITYLWRFISTKRIQWSTYCAWFSSIMYLPISVLISAFLLLGSSFNLFSNLLSKLQVVKCQLSINLYNVSANVHLLTFLLSSTSASRSSDLVDNGILLCSGLFRKPRSHTLSTSWKYCMWKGQRNYRVNPPN